jgi:hypothetical protein
VNLVLEYGFDALSQAYDELEQFAAAGVASHNIAVFRRTADEAWDARGVDLGHDAGLEAAYVGDTVDSARIDFATNNAITRLRPSSLGELAGTVVVRLRPLEAIDGSGGPARDPWFRVDNELYELAQTAGECLIVGDDTFIGAELYWAGGIRSPGLRVPALTVIHPQRPPTLYFRPQIKQMNEDLRVGRIPADLAWVGAFGVDGTILRDMLKSRPDRISVSALVASSLSSAWEAGMDGIGLFSATSAVSASMEDLECLGGPRLARGLARCLAGENRHG